MKKFLIPLGSLVWVPGQLCLLLLCASVSLSVEWELRWRPRPRVVRRLAVWHTVRSAGLASSSSLGEGGHGREMLSLTASGLHYIFLVPPDYG